MAQVSTRISGANTALAIGVERAFVESVTRVLDVHFALRSEEQPVTGGTGRENAVHHVDAHAGVFDDLFGGANAHQIARLFLREMRLNGLNGFVGEGAWLANTKASDGISGKIHTYETLGAFAAEVGIHAALDDGEKGLARFDVSRFVVSR